MALAIAGSLGNPTSYTTERHSSATLVLFYQRSTLNGQISTMSTFLMGQSGYSGGTVDGVLDFSAYNNLQRPTSDYYRQTYTPYLPADLTVDNR